MKIQVCDAVMGSGKTTAAINMMNEQIDKRFIFITPFLAEVQRIKKSCAIRDFDEPSHSDEARSKLDSLKYLLKNKSNIASTHALLKRYDEATEHLIREGGYTLIVDEVVDVVEVLTVGEYSVQLMLDNEIVDVGEDGRVYWLDDSYPLDDSWSELMQTIKNGHVLMSNGKLMLWELPIEIFEAFDNVIILTYMFDAQVQKYYYDLYGVEYEFIGTRKHNGNYEFCDLKEVSYNNDFKKLLHVYEDDKLNEIGDGEYALSVSWFRKELGRYYNKRSKRSKLPIEQLKANAMNMMRNRWNVRGGQAVWTTFDVARSFLTGNGYGKSFLSYNTRAVNDYGTRQYLMYFVNVFFLVDVKQYFLEHKIPILEEEYALSMMLQWIWRSAIRNGKEIWIYVPSKRMRRLLKEWLNEGEM